MTAHDIADHFADKPADGVTWRAGDASIQSQIEHALTTRFHEAILLHESQHRTVHRVQLENAPDDPRGMTDVVIKIHRTATGRHRLRETWKRRLGLSPTRREWKALEELFDAGVSVPRPRAWGRLNNGDGIIVSDFIDGERVADAGSEVVDALASAIAKFHDSGYRHGDLHLGNLLAVDQRIVLLDLQRARPQRNARDRLWDLSRLELSLAKAGWNSTARAALRDRLDVGEDFGPILRRFLRDHQRGRARRVLRVGRNWSAARVGALRGLRVATLGEDTLARLVESCDRKRGREPEANILERRGGRVQLIETRLDDSGDDKTLVLVKCIAAGGLRRALGDRLRGTAAARAFHAGQASGLLSKRAARPLAFLEERRLGLPTKSLLVLEKVGDEDLDRALPSSPDTEHRLATALGEWLADGHAWGLSHRDLKANNIRVTVGTDAIQFWLVDLEDLNGPAEISDKARLHALSQLNASLDDEAMSTESRLATLSAYEARVPFALTEGSPACVITRESLARAHRWRGGGGGVGGNRPVR
jgi:tRNA A-37 threonylcarbamoyl transferase component Bud32